MSDSEAPSGMGGDAVEIKPILDQDDGVSKPPPSVVAEIASILKIAVSVFVAVSAFVVMKVTDRYQASFCRTLVLLH